MSKKLTIEEKLEIALELLSAAQEEEYDEICAEMIEEQQEGKRYKLISNFDGNDEIELQSTTYEDAVIEALDYFGRTIVTY